MGSLPAIGSETARSFTRAAPARWIMNYGEKVFSARMIEAALAEVVDDDQMAYQLASQKINRYDSLDFNEFRSRLGGMLSRRGFSYETVTRVVNRLWSERKAGITQD